jgi:hypothetical protein
MSRYYKIVITDPQTGEILIPNYNGKPGFSRLNYSPLLATYTSLYAGGTVSSLGSVNGNALRVDLDIPVTYMHEPMANSYIRIYGISLQEIAQGANLQGMNIAVYGGFAKGLPLANPAQSGLLCSGQIYQCFGNWIGVEQTLDIYMVVGGSSPTSNQTTGLPSGPSTVPVPTTNFNPANITFQWEPGQPLMTPVIKALSTAYPKYNIQGAVHEGLVWTGTAATAFFAKLSQFAEYLNRASINLISGYAPDRSYQGVSLTLQNNTIAILDGTTATNPKQIQIVDLIGQPTWSQPYTIQSTCHMRADIKVGDYVKLPATPGTTQPGSSSQFFNTTPGNVYSQAKNGSVFTGLFQVSAVRHVGSSRDGQGTAWVTTLDMQSRSEPTATVDTLPTVYVGDNSFNFFLPR